jgi:hypothetical protein
MRPLSPGTRRGVATSRPSRCAPWVRGRATGTCPKGCPLAGRGGIRVIDDPVLNRERAHPRPLTRINHSATEMFLLVSFQQNANLDVNRTLAYWRPV